MKKTVKAGVLTGLILAPGAVVSANGMDVANDAQQLEPAATVETVEAGVVPYNAVADLDVRKLRLEEIFNLNEKSSISDAEIYRQLVKNLLPDNPDTPTEVEYENDVELLIAKINFLEKLQGLKSDASSLTNEISLLKTTHPALFETVPELEKDYIAISQEFKIIRAELDAVINEYEGNDYDLNAEYSGAFETKALGGMKNYLATIEDFEKEFIKNIATLKTFIEDIKKSDAFIYSVPLLDNNGDPILDDNGNPKKSPGYVNDIANSDELDTTDPATSASDFKKLVEDANKYYNEKMTANEKKIADSHVLADGRTVAAVMKQANDDLTKANKVAELITGIGSVTAADFKSKVGKVVSEYEKLNVRAQMLVLEYETKVANKTDGGKNAGYKDGLDFIALVDALKPNATEEYRKALKEAEDAYGLLTDGLQDLLKSYDAKLDVYRADVTVAQAVEKSIEDVAAADDIAKARKEYDALTSAQKKIVNNYKELQAWEKSGKTTIKLSDQIDVVAIEKTKNFATKVDTLNKSFDKLSKDEQELMEKSPSSAPSVARLKYLTPFAKATGSFYSLKTTSPSYREDVLALLANVEALKFDAITDDDDKTALQNLKEDLKTDVTTLKSQLNSAKTVIDKITAAQGETTKVNQLLAIQAARTAYNGLPKEEQKLVTNLKTLTELEKVIKQPVAVIKAIEAADPENISKFPSTAKSAVTAFDKLTATQKSYLPDDYQKRIEDFKVYLAFVDQMKALKPNAAGFQEAYVAAEKKFGELTADASTNNVWKSTLKPKIIEAVFVYIPTLNEHKTSITGGLSVYKMIDDLKGKYGKDFLDTITKIEVAYAALSADAKKQVTNYKQFQELKKDGTVALKVVDLINDDAITNVNVADSGYVKKVESAAKAFEKLTSSQKAHVYNSAYLERNLPIYEIVKAINNLKPSAKTYIEDIAAVRQMYNRLTPANQRYLEPILYKIEGAETGLVTVNEVMDLIDAARPGVEDYVQKLTAAREAYDKLARINSAYQKLVLNYKTLTEREKALKPVTTAIYQIKELEEILARPVIDSNELVKKYNNAVKAYEKIPYESRELVYNREVLLSTMYPVAKTMEAIANIKPSSKTFAEDVKKARDWYNSLSPADQARVSNYNDLVAFENTVSGGAAVDEKIRQLPSTPPTQYMQAIKEARAAYDALTANEKKAVALYKELQNYEKGVKNVQATVDAIDNLQFASNLVSAYDKATKALDKLTADQRQMVPNMDKLRNVGPAIDVYKMIAALKPSNANYAGSVQAAYSAYNMLSSSEKQFVTNFATLQEAKNNVDSVQAVISKISSISPSSRNYAEQVAEALAMYNSLPSAVRKQVTNFDVLKSSQKEADTVDKVRQLISEINPSTSNFASKVKSARSAYDKLTTQQKRLVSNYFLLEDYEAQLGGSTLFF